MHWQLQEAKQRFSELLRSVESDGVQVVTRHGQEVAAVIDIATYRRLTGEAEDFKGALLSMPKVDIEFERSTDFGRDIDFGGDR